MDTTISRTAANSTYSYMNPCTVFQKNDIFSGLGDDSSFSLDSQGVRDQGKDRNAHPETRESADSEGIEEVSNTDGDAESRNHPGDANPPVDTPSENVDRSLRAAEERYY